MKRSLLFFAALLSLCLVATFGDSEILVRTADGDDRPSRSAEPSDRRAVSEG